MLRLFRDNHVRGILATSRPNDGTRALVEAKADGLRVVPFLRPYRVRADIPTWFADPDIYALVETEFGRGYYVGIGEFHIYGDSAAGPWVKRLVDFAVARDLYLHAHADDRAIEHLFAHDARAKVIWAHTGFTTPPEKVAAYLDRHPTLWGELSYRGGIVAGDGRLSNDWRWLFERYPDRFLLGSDTWINERWASYGEIMAGYRAWLAELPPPVAEAIAYRNAERLFAR